MTGNIVLEFNQSRFLGRVCDEALSSETKGSHLKRGDPIQ